MLARSRRPQPNNSQVPADDAHYRKLLLVDGSSAGRRPAAHKLHERLESAAGRGARAAVTTGRALGAKRIYRALDSLGCARRSQPAGLSTRIRPCESGSPPIDPASGRRQAASSAPAESRYEILEQIGAGEWAWFARDRRLARGRWAPARQPRPSDRGIFLRGSAPRPNIVTIHDADQNGTFFITMEPFKGDPLRDPAARRRTACASRGCVQICAGLAYAHERRIVHRTSDSNLFFTRQGREDHGFRLAKMPKRCAARRR